MSYIDLLQELGRARRALEDLIAATSGPGTKDLLTKRDAITSAMNRIADERAHLEQADVTAAVSNLDMVATELGSLATTTKDIAQAVALVDAATTTVGSVLAANDRRVANAPTLMATASLDGQLFSAFCRSHNAEIPPTKVALDEAIQNKSDHLAIAENAKHDVVIILVK